VASAPLTVPPEQRDVVVALAGLTLERAAPEELEVLEDTAREYFEDPHGLLSPVRRDEPLGFGLDFALLAPYALAIASTVVHALLGAAEASAQGMIKPRIDALLRRILRTQPEAPAPIDAETAQRLHQVALDRATALGLDPGRAALLADSLVGALTVPA
jgi:hypothetical protein